MRLIHPQISFESEPFPFRRCCGNPPCNFSARWLMNLRYVLIPNDGTIMEWMTLPTKNNVLIMAYIIIVSTDEWECVVLMMMREILMRDTVPPWQNFAVTPWNWQTHLLFFFCVFENEATRRDPADYHGYTLIYLALSSYVIIAIWGGTPSYGIPRTMFAWSWILWIWAMGGWNSTLCNSTHLRKIDWFTN